MNSIEKARVKTGLTKPQMIELLESKPYRLALFTADDKDLDPAFLQRAEYISRHYDDWKADMREALREADAEAEGNPLTPEQAARVLGISEFHLVQLRTRGIVEAEKLGRWRWAYRVSALLKLVELNSTYLLENAGRSKTRGPLAKSFLTWLKTHNKATAAVA